MVTPDEGREIVVAGGFSVATRVETSNAHHDVSELASTQEEADTDTLAYFCFKAARHGFQKIVVCSQDTNVLVMLITCMPQLTCEELWFHCGTSQKCKFIAIHKVVIQDKLRNSLLQFHAITGSDTTSQFAGIGKNSMEHLF